MAEPDVAYATPDAVAPFLVADAGYPVGPRGQPVITVRPKPKAPPPAADKPPTEGARRSIEDQPEFVDDTVPAQARPANAPPAKSIEDQPEFVDDRTPMEPEREVSFGQAVGAGVRGGPTFGFEPVVQGLKAAGQAEGGGLIDQIAGHIASGTDMNPLALISKAIGLPSNSEIVQGIARIAMDKVQGTTQATQAYTQGRDTTLETNELAAKQHPGAYYPGLVASSLAVPVPGLGAAAGATRGANFARGLGTGAVMGGVQGIGEGVSRGEDLPQVAARGAIGTGIGGVAGGTIGAVLPKAAPAVSTALSGGQRAAQTAADLGGSIPRGLASDKGWLQTFTAGMKSFPLFGARISHQVGDVQERAGNRLHDIATDLTGGPADRAAAGAEARKGAEEAIEKVKDKIDQSYDSVRNAIDQNARFPMPRTQAALDKIKADRAEAGWENPGLGLEQWENVSQGATFKGGQRARTDARAAGGGANPHPGFDKGDFNSLTGAMTDDLRANVYAAAHGDAAAKQAAVDAFDQADRRFGPASDFNKFMRDIADDNSESAISRLMNTAQAKKGDLTLLSQLRATMPPEAFNQIGGQILHELGSTPGQPGQFSLAKFVTEYNKLSPRARDLLFSPQHRQAIDNIFQMGEHLKGALKTANTSHTAAPLIVMDLARDAIMTGAGVAVGAISGAGVAASAAAATPAVVFAHWVSSPATAGAISNWTTAYRAATLGAPTPARIAAFKIASRNLANNLNIPVEQVMRTIQNRLPASAQPSSDNERPEVPGPR